MSLNWVTSSMRQTKPIFFSFILMIILLDVVATTTTNTTDPKTALRRRSLRALEQDPKTVEIKAFPPKKTVITVFGGSGMCSQLVNMLCQKLYVRDQGGQLFMVDESTYEFRWTEDLGFLKAFFKPSVPLIENEDDYSRIQAQFGISYYEKKRRWDSRFVNFAESSNQAPIIIRASGKTRKPCCHPFFQDKLNFNNNTLSMAVYQRELMETAYQRMSDEACTTLQLKDWTINKIKELKNMHKIPDFRKGSTVAFHVRRGDKIVKKESRVYPGSHYVDKLLQITQEEPIDHCFVASDDYAAVEEVAVALRERNVNCKVHTLTSKSETGAVKVRGKDGIPRHTVTSDDTLKFLAEMSILIDAKYFIGTFNSNVATYVALQRKCLYKDADHYAHSYGVDRDTWIMR